MVRSRTLSLVVAVAVAITMASSPAMAGKKKKSGDDLNHGHLYEAQAPLTKRRQVLDTAEPELVSEKTAPIQSAGNSSSEPGPQVFHINGVETLVLHLLFE